MTACGVPGQGMTGDLAGVRTTRSGMTRPEPESRAPLRPGTGARPGTGTRPGTEMRPGTGARREQGSGTVLAVALLTLLGSLLVGVLAVGTALAAGARARTAADAAALAAAGAVADLASAAQGCAAAAIYAGRNGAELTRCGIDGPVAQVTVRVSAGRLGWATARARAGPATPAAPRR